MKAGAPLKPKRLSSLPGKQPHEESPIIVPQKREPIGTVTNLPGKVLESIRK
jgi:hypothetical protein